MTCVYKDIASPVGVLRLVARDGKLAAILWENDRPGRVRLPALTASPDEPVLCETERQLGEYFAGKRRTFSIPLDFDGTDFQRRVRQALLEIPYGETRSYGQIAASLGDPKSVRAVGAANGRNPVSIIAPCHRVIGADGDLTGFAGGLDRKLILLRLEGREAVRTQPDLFDGIG